MKVWLLILWTDTPHSEQVWVYEEKHKDPALKSLEVATNLASLFGTSVGHKLELMEIK